jgi:hypothetical protein
MCVRVCVYLPLSLSSCACAYACMLQCVSVGADVSLPLLLVTADLKKQKRRAAGATISKKGGKYGSKRYSAPHKQRGQLQISQVDAAQESEKSRRAASPFLSAVDFTSGTHAQWGGQTGSAWEQRDRAEERGRDDVCMCVCVCVFVCVGEYACVYVCWSGKSVRRWGWSRCSLTHSLTHCVCLPLSHSLSLCVCA